jgi:hypothetical protein
MSLSASRNAWIKLRHVYQHRDPALVYLLLPYVMWAIEVYRIRVRFQHRWVHQNMARIMGALGEAEKNL